MLYPIISLCLQPVLHHVAWVLFCFVFILETIAVRPKIFKIINATHQQFEFGITVLLLQAEEMAMNFKPRQGFVISYDGSMNLTFLSFLDFSILPYAGFLTPFRTWACIIMKCVINYFYLRP